MSVGSVLAAAAFLPLPFAFAGAGTDAGGGGGGAGIELVSAGEPFWLYSIEAGELRGLWFATAAIVRSESVSCDGQSPIPSDNALGDLYRASGYCTVW